ncbi:hypothetical protein Bbelb_075270 [Branchiostoma belcheri]|nr:hypothetical protein Bbelb_075270 [Branchiostoma belcheri]
MAEVDDPRLRRLLKARTAEDESSDEELDRVARHQRVLDPEVQEEAEGDDEPERLAREEESSGEEDLDEEEIERRCMLMRLRARERAQAEEEEYSDSEDETGLRLKPVGEELKLPLGQAGVSRWSRLLQMFLFRAVLRECASQPPRGWGRTDMATGPGEAEPGEAELGEAETLFQWLGVSRWSRLLQMFLFRAVLRECASQPPRGWGRTDMATGPGEAEPGEAETLFEEKQRLYLKRSRDFI